jgi:hypothetical protein
MQKTRQTAARARLIGRSLSITSHGNDVMRVEFHGLEQIASHEQ